MSEITEAIAILRSGGVVAFPTETVYGLGADATNSAAVQRIFQLKGRPNTNPLICHVADAEVARRYARTWPPAASELADHFWPGPLTLVLPKSDVIVDEVTAGLDSVGLRAPNHPLALELLRLFDGPIAGPSANRSSHISPTTADHVRADLGNSVDLVLDGGPCSVGIESTVIDLTSPTPTILRPGAISRDQIESVIGTVELSTTSIRPDAPARSPGQHEKHYAPTTAAFRFLTSQRGLIQVDINDIPTGIMAMCTSATLHRWDPIVAMPNRPDLYAKHFYAVLRDLDAMSLSAIFIELPPDLPEWLAIRDRITRATQPLPT